MNRERERAQERSIQGLSPPGPIKSSRPNEFEGEDLSSTMGSL